MSEEECEARLAALDRSCEADADCALGSWNHCSIYDRSEVVGLSSGELDDLAELSGLCGRPSAPTDCIGEGGGISPPVTEDGLEPRLGSGLSAAVRCVEQRCVSYAATCGAELCGNGEIDACTISSGQRPEFTPSPAPTEGGGIEACDGSMLDATCKDHGFAAGELACVAESCTLDLRGCEICAEPSGVVVDCRTEEPGNVDWLVPAATAGELAILMLAGGELRVRTYGTDLVQRGDVVIPRGDATVWGKGAIARGPEGWVVAVETINPYGYAVYVLPLPGGVQYALTGTGEVRDPVLVEQPDAKPLLVLNVPSIEGPLTAEVIRFGTTYGLQRSLTLPNGVSSGVRLANAVFLTQVVAGRTQLVRVEPDLTAHAVLGTLSVPAEGVFSARLQRSEDGAVVLQEGQTPPTAWLTRLDELGAEVGDTVRAAHDGGGLVTPGAFIAVSGAVLVPDLGWDGGLRQVGVELQGGQTIDEALIAAPASQPNAVALGGHAIITFRTGSGFGVARSTL